MSLKPNYVWVIVANNGFIDSVHESYTFAHARLDLLKDQNPMVNASINLRVERHELE